LGREIKSYLAADCKQRAANAATEIESYLGAGNVKEAWRTLKGWYRSAEDRPPPACHDTMVKQTAERVDLYAKAPPLGPPLPNNFPFFAISDDLPSDSEVRKVVRGLKNGRAAGATGMKAEHLKGWLDAIQREEKAAEEDPGRESTLGDKWRVFLQLIQTIWDRGEISRADELDGDRPAAEGRRRFPRDRSTRPMLESSGENHGVPTGYH